VTSSQRMERVSILVVDDEPCLRKVIRTTLAASGYAVEEACNGEEAIGKTREHPFDLVLLDMNMPGMRGIDACRGIRGTSPNAGIIMVTVCDMEDEKVHALEAGADDYVTKPFKLRELTARLRAVLRRTRRETHRPEILQAGNLKMDLHRRTLWKGDAAVHLSPTEFNLLAFMMKTPDTTLTHIKLLCTIWGPAYAAERDYLRAYIKALRKKIEDDTANPKYVLTEAWVGYRFHNPSEPDSRFVAMHESAVPF